MKHRIPCQTALALGALAGLFVAAPASAITPPGTPQGDKIKIGKRYTLFSTPSPDHASLDRKSVV